MINRIAACAAMEGIPQPTQWAGDNLWRIIARTEWVNAWGFAEDNKTVNDNPDSGARDDVINDGMILSAVQAVRGEETDTP